MIKLEKPSPSLTRNYKFDNIKAIAIFLVVFGHFIEPFAAAGIIKYIYVFIYVFHMPLFAFCSGYFAKYDTEKIVKRIFYPYIVFQILYSIFRMFILKTQVLEVVFPLPYWIMWYMLALGIWTILLPFFDTTRFRKQVIILVCTFAIGCLAGYDNSTGYYMALSRTIVFLPFFLAGYYYKNHMRFSGIFHKYNSIKLKLLAGCILIGVGVAIYFLAPTINSMWLYGVHSYKAQNYSMFDRSLYYLLALIIIGCIGYIVPNIKLFFTNIGSHTVQVYLLHGFIIKYLYEVLNLTSIKISQPLFLIASLVASTITVVVLSSRPVVKFTKPLMQLPLKNK